MSGLRRGHRPGEQPEGPSIRVLRLPDATDAALRELLAGIEEEGVPVTVHAATAGGAPLSPGDASGGPPRTAADGAPVPHAPADGTPVVEPIAAAAHRAARAATLRVGVAVSADAACVQLAALPADAPPLLHRVTPGPDALRRLGQDAARLVKSVPLTPSPTDPTPDRSLR